MGQLLAKLGDATQPWHAAVDATWRELRQPTARRVDYLAALTETFGFIAPLESACRYTDGLDRWFDKHQLTRAGLIAQDLVGLGMVPSVMTRAPQCIEITTFGSVAEALGWLYVVQRAAVVYDGLRAHLVARIPGLETGVSFLDATDGVAHDRLARFGETIERVSEADQIAAAACSAFACAERWTHHAQRVAS